MSAQLGKLIFAGLIATVIFTALAHGTVEPWSLAVFELMIVGLVLMWGAKFVLDKNIAVSVPKATLPLAALLALGLIQSIAFETRDGSRLSLSMDAEATRVSVLALFFLVIAFIIAANFIVGHRRLRAVAFALTIYGLVMAVFALVQHFTWNGSFYWLRQASAGVTAPFGPFANHNHFAGYMEMLMPLPIAMVITKAANRDWRLFNLFAATMMAVAAIASLSRGGMISLAAELIFIALLNWRAESSKYREIEHSQNSAKAARKSSSRSRRKASVLSISSLRAAAMIALMVAAIAAGVYWTGHERVLNRVAQTAAVSDDPKAETFFASRGWIWRDTLTMISANPILGVGLGAYETAYPRYAKDDVRNSAGASYSVDRAHNDYLQTLADCGIIGGAIIVWFILSLFRAVAIGAKSREPLYRALAIGGGAGLFGLLTHSLFDFNLQLPSNALLFLLIAATVSRIGAVAHERAAKKAAKTSEQVSEFAFVTGVSSR